MLKILLVSVPCVILISMVPVCSNQAKGWVIGLTKAIRDSKEDINQIVIDSTYIKCLMILLSSPTEHSACEIKAMKVIILQVAFPLPNQVSMSTH